MNIPKRIIVACIAALLCNPPILYAAETQPEQRQTPMVSGGIGDAELEDISAIQKQYRLKLVFAETMGAYVADVGVQVHDRRGNMLVNTVSQGPILLINLTPGTYILSSTVPGETKTQRIVVRGDSLETHYIHFHPTES